MPKQKTHKGAAKRFKVTRKGKVIHRMAGKGHLLAHKRRKRKRKYTRDRVLPPMEADKILRLLGYKG